MKAVWTGYVTKIGGVGKGVALALPTLSLLALANTALAADLALDFQDSPNIGAAGGVFVYSLEARNNGPQGAGLATGVQTEFNLPLTGSTYGEFIGYRVIGGSGLCSYDAGLHRVSCSNLPDLALNDTVLIEIDVRLPVAGVYSSSASTSTTSADPNPGNNSSSQTTTAQAASDLVLEASSGAAAGIQAGTPYSYQLQVRNDGPDAMPADSTMQVSFQVPSGASVTSVPSGAGWSCSPANAGAYPLSNNELITCQSSQLLAVGGNASPINVAAVSNTQGDVSASFRVAGFKQNGDPLPDGNETNNTDSVLVSFQAGSDVSITKRRTSPSGSGAVAQGSEVIYRLTPRHEGGQAPGQSGNIVVTDTLGAGLSFLSPAFVAGSGWSCAVAGDTLTCTRPGPWTAGNFSDMPSIDVRAQADSTGTLTNTASISIPESDSNPGNNTSSVNITSSDEADLVMQKAGPRYAVTVNEPFVYWLSVRNTGPLAVTAGQSIRVTDSLPAGVEAIGLPVGNGWDCSASTLTSVDCVRSSALSSGSTTDAIAVQVRATAAGTLQNSACTVLQGGGPPFDRNAGNDCTAPIETLVTNERADLSMDKSASSNQVKTGESLTYTLLVSNQGPDTATNVIVEDDLRSLLTQGGLQSVSISPAPAAGFGCRLGNSGPYLATLGPVDGASQDLRCNLGTLANGSSATVSVEVLPLVATNAPRVNTATVFSPDVGDGNQNDNTDSATGNVSALVDIQALKTRPSASIPAGAPLLFTASVRNDGPSTASDVHLVDSLPNNAPFLGLDNAGGGTCTVPAIGSLGGTLECTWATVPNNTTRNVIYRVRAMNEGDVIDNSVVVSTSTEENDVLSNTATTSTQVTAAVLDIVVNKSDNPNIVALGQSSQYTITIDNGGPSAGTNLTMIDTFPVNSAGGDAPTALFSYQGGLRVYRGGVEITADTSQYSCSEPSIGATSGTLTCSFNGYFDSGAAEQRQVSYFMRAESVSGVAGVAVGSSHNHVAVSVNETETQLDNNEAIETTSARRDSIPTDLGGTKTASPGALVKGQNVVYTIVVSNNGGAGGASVDSLGAQLIDPLPSGLQFISATPAEACSNSGGTVTCQVGLLTTGQSRSFSITAKLDDDYSGPRPLVNQAHIDAPGDPEPGNNDPISESPVIESSVGAPTLSHLGLMMLTMLLSALAWRARRS